MSCGSFALQETISYVFCTQYATLFYLLLPFLTFYILQAYFFRNSTIYTVLVFGL